MYTVNRDNDEDVDGCVPGQQCMPVDVGMKSENDNKTGGGGDNVRNLPACVFSRGWCKQHKIKGDKTTRKSKKWARKKSGYNGYDWVTTSLVEYSSSLGCSGLPVSDDVTGEGLNEKAVLKVQRGEVQILLFRGI